MPATKTPAKKKAATTKRTATAKRKPAAKAAKPTKVPARAAAELVLLERGKPTHYREITRLALEQGIVKVKRGAKPEQTMKTIRSFLAGSVAEGDPRFVRIDDGVFELTKEGKQHARKVKKETAAS